MHTAGLVEAFDGGASEDGRERRRHLTADGTRIARSLGVSPLVAENSARAAFSLAMKLVDHLTTMRWVPRPRVEQMALDVVSLTGVSAETACGFFLAEAKSTGLVEEDGDGWTWVDHTQQLVRDQLDLAAREARLPSFLDDLLAGAPADVPLYVRMSRDLEALWISCVNARQGKGSREVRLLGTADLLAQPLPLPTSKSVFVYDSGRLLNAELVTYGDAVRAYEEAAVSKGCVADVRTVPQGFELLEVR
jgi:hypothetical protein